MNKPQLTGGASSESRIENLQKIHQRIMRPQDTIAVVTDSESEDDFRKKPFFRVPSPGKTAKRTKRGSQSSAYSTPPSPGSFHPPQQSGRRLSSEEIINQMEKEQDAMVMRLLKEIDLLREENVRLRRSLNQLSSNMHKSDHSGSLDLGLLSRQNSTSSSSLSQLQLQSQQQPASGLLGVGNVTTSSSTTDSRRPSSSSQLLDSLTPELQRKRNSVTKNELDFMEGYSPTLRTGNAILTPNISTGAESFPRRASSIVCGSRRRRSSGKHIEESDPLSINPSSVNKIPKRAGSPTSLTVGR
ncbi:unnamed protein product [Kluyveromyces dobzhanskii CBS 2104]|uniref:WGS project CCBQ000000000 data, contig 00015 n=1 Tax=Kluyveromyces dobzhanskii CBS 2104 TaxID=1427455 RepID=A0A0A8LB75_9SACH|nr:unnamed protein product [Kluyveromyces dobzhanskii CBS 2104]